MSAESKELALESQDCIVSYASCGHEDVASSKNIIDGSRSSFWATTGLYPQFFILSFPKPISISSITLRTYCVRGIIIERCAGDLSTGFEEVRKVDVLLTDLHHQVTNVDLNFVNARHLRFTIVEGFQEFCAVYKVEVLAKQTRS